MAPGDDREAGGVMETPDAQMARLGVDEQWMGEWVAFGLADLERYLRRQAQFDAYLRRRRPDDAA
jgi:hypothetical protein